MSLEIAVEEANAGDSFEAWLETTASQLPEPDGNIFHEIQAIHAMCRNPEAAAHPGYPLDYDTELDDLIYVNCTDYMEDMSSHEISALQRPSSPSYWRGRLSPEQQVSVREDINVSSGVGVLSGVPSSRNGGGGKIYTQNEFRSAHGASRNTSRAPSVHVDDFYSNS